MFTQGTLQPGQRQVLYQRDQGLSGMEEEGLAFGLDRDGDTLILIDPQGHRIDAVTFGSQWTDHSLSRDDDGTWTLGLPTPGAAHQSAPVAERSSLRLNEIMASPLPGEPDWLEWVNGHPNLPLALEGLHLRLNQALVALPHMVFWGHNRCASWKPMVHPTLRPWGCVCRQWVPTSRCWMCGGR